MRVPGLDELVVTVVVVVLCAVLGVLCGQWLVDRSRETRRRVASEEREREYRRGVYARFVAAGLALRPMVSFDTGEDALGSMGEAAAHIKLIAPEIAGGPLIVVLDAARRLERLLAHNLPTSPVVKEADDEFQQALSILRDLMLDDIRIAA